jgi:hypothetical protein
MVLPPGRGANTEEERATDTPAEKKSPSKRAAFPFKYRDPTTSGLSFTVKAGPNELSLDLKSK